MEHFVTPRTSRLSFVLAWRQKLPFNLLPPRSSPASSHSNSSVQLVTCSAKEGVLDGDSGKLRSHLPLFNFVTEGKLFHSFGHQFLHLKATFIKCCPRWQLWEGVDRGWHGWMASPTQCTGVWANSRRWGRTGKPGVLQALGDAESDMTQQLNWAHGTGCPTRIWMWSNKTIPNGIGKKACFSFLTISVLVFWGYQNKISQAGWLKQQFIFSELRRLDDQDQEVSRFDFFRGLSPGLADACFLSCVHTVVCMSGVSLSS